MLRKTLLPGVLAAVGAVLAMLIATAADLDVEAVALLGVAVGAVLAIVPDAALGWRLVGFAGGLVVCWVGYLLRAAVLPDSTGGRAVWIGLVLLLATAVAMAGLGRIPLWSALLGAATLAGAYELTYSEAPPEVVSTSTGAVTSLLLMLGVGFLAGSATAPESGERAERPSRPARTPSSRPARPARSAETADTDLDSMLEKNR